MTPLVARLSAALLIMACIGLPAEAIAGTYWVSPAGAAAWPDCSGETPLNGAAACSLATANASVQPGDTVMLRGGTYDTHIFPARSGVDVQTRIAYRGYPGETAVVRNTTTPYATYYHGILLRDRRFVLIDGVTVSNPIGAVPVGKDRPLMITHGSSYNEISNCEINGNGGGVIQVWDGLIEGGVPVSHNWIHHCRIHDTGALAWSGSYVNDVGGMQLGVPSYDDISGNNTFEHNEFACGGHHALETFTKRNVIRNNFFHHEGCMPNLTGYAAKYGPDANGLWGNRNLQVYDGLNSDGMFNLIEGNRFGPSGPPPDDDGGDGLTITAPKNIIRYNEIYGAQNNGVLFKTGAGSVADHNRFYNNTIFSSGRYRNAGPLWQGLNFRWYGGYQRVGNVIKNNILFGYGAGGGDWGGGTTTTDTDNTITSNFCTNAMAGRCSGFGDPLFANASVEAFRLSATAPDLALQPSSPAIDAGSFLTRTTNGGNGATALSVEDALYFQDGTWGSILAGHQADWVAIGTPTNAVQIRSVDYTSKTVSLASPASWAPGDRVWLYQKSDGKRVLFGENPDCGAHEAQSAPRAPAAVRIIR